MDTDGGRTRGAAGGVSVPGTWPSQVRSLGSENATTSRFRACPVSDCERRMLYWLLSPFAGMSRGNKCARQSSAIATVHKAPKPA